ncbi:pyridine nucleotide-disulphide oxidoreductase family protein [Stylonychia lemnae]|uniref:Pyridine nucleotide-disulphide oxidoreductase family protein n=1 Tax=Stylonychia lemnae TaxID=5949 RepID=A0A078APY9_STYLE|nr:pyridine nucleotide-disulphide oxidoreductase family protein [Stylonychia lemnae]|eukprot:CDW84041.1 pyridine nucleotide-disulphide oxidoreductase family protein [Stylonychia lemnae]
MVSLATAILMLGSSPSKDKSESEPESDNTENQEQEQQPKSFVKNVLDSFEIPKLLKEREQQKLKEYLERDETDITEIERDITPEDIEDMRELDKTYSIEQYDKDSKQKQLEKQASYILDPYSKKESTKMRHQEYRIIKIGKHDLLKNGQMVQISVCDPFNDNLFHPTDRVIIAKHEGQYHAVGSFCGFDYTNLATGAFLGEKLICPTCGSTYDIKNGFVDQGPSLRNISSFSTSIREEQVQLITPEHIPAFSLKNHIQREHIDPRVFAVIGDSEAALSAIDALRTQFTGRIVLIPTSSYGQFENLDILNRKFSPIQKNESYLVEKDFLDRANVEVVAGELSSIDLNKNEIGMKGQKSKIKFDKVMIAWGSQKKRIQNLAGSEYSNVYYLEDRFSHAKVHNEILKAKTILVMGGTFEAYQTASSVRKYLDSVGQTETEIILLDHQPSEVEQAFGGNIASMIHKMLRDQRISVIMSAEITKMRGIDKLDSIYFKRNNQKKGEKKIEYFIKPDIVIAENGLGAPKIEIKKLLTPDVHAESDEPPLAIGVDSNGIPACDIKFSLHYNDIHSPIFACGSCTQYPSFMQKTKVRTQDVKYNIESAFFAAMNMMDKRVEFRYIPFTPLKLGDTPIYFIGERNQGFHEIIIEGDVEARKFIAYFVYGKEVCGVLTVGYQNLHLYIWEAMRMLIMPAAAQLRNQSLTYQDIVRAVLRSRPFIKCKRSEIVRLPSVMLAEFDQELEKSAELSEKVKANIKIENQRQRVKFEEMKEKYDREGVEFVQDEMDILNQGGKKQNDKAITARTRSGGYKPGSEDSGNIMKQRNLNIGGEDKNPFSQLFNMAKQDFKGPR